VLRNARQDLVVVAAGEDRVDEPWLGDERSARGVRQRHARDLDFGIVVVRDACYAMRGPNHDFLMDRIFPRMSRVMTVDQATALMQPKG
jgi:hypothetical protein